MVAMCRTMCYSNVTASDRPIRRCIGRKLRKIVEYPSGAKISLQIIINKSCVLVSLFLLHLSGTRSGFSRGTGGPCRPVEAWPPPERKKTHAQEKSCSGLRAARIGEENRKQMVLSLHASVHEK